MPVELAVDGGEFVGAGPELGDLAVVAGLLRGELVAQRGDDRVVPGGRGRCPGDRFSPAADLVARTAVEARAISRRVCVADAFPRLFAGSASTRVGWAEAQIAAGCGQRLRARSPTDALELLERTLVRDLRPWRVGDGRREAFHVTGDDPFLGLPRHVVGHRVDRYSVGSHADSVSGLCLGSEVAGGCRRRSSLRAGHSRGDHGRRRGGGRAATAAAAASTWAFSAAGRASTEDFTTAST